MRVHVLYAHPSPMSFVGAVHVRAVEVLRAGGHEVDDLDLYAENFDPVLSRAQFASYVDVERNTAEVETYVQRLRAADALVLVYPVWFDGLPAILQGYFQRVFLPGVATVIDGDGLFHRNLDNLQRLAAVCAYGESEARRGRERRPALPLRARQHRRADKARRPIRIYCASRHELSRPGPPHGVPAAGRAGVRGLVNFTRRRGRPFPWCSRTLPSARRRRAM